MPKRIADAQIFQVVMDTVAARGYAGATTRQIAAAAGVSEITLFRKYGTKAELVTRAIAALVDRSAFRSATRYTGDLRADLARVLQAYRDVVVQHDRFFSVLLGELQRTPELAESFEQPLKLFQAIGRLLARYQKAGVLKPEPPLHGVAALLGPLIYLALIRQSTTGLAVPPPVVDVHLDHFLGGRACTRPSIRQRRTAVNGGVAVLKGKRR